VWDYTLKGSLKLIGRLVFRLPMGLPASQPELEA